MDYPNPDMRRVRGLIQTGINVVARTPATEIVQPMAKHRNKRKPILDGLSSMARVGRIVGCGAEGA